LGFRVEDSRMGLVIRAQDVELKVQGSGSTAKRAGFRADDSAIPLDGLRVYRGTSLIIPPPPSGPYRKPMPRDLWRS